MYRDMRSKILIQHSHIVDDVLYVGILLYHPVLCNVSFYITVCPKCPKKILRTFQPLGILKLLFNYSKDRRMPFIGDMKIQVQPPQFLEKNVRSSRNFNSGV